MYENIAVDLKTFKFITTMVTIMFSKKKVSYCKLVEGHWQLDRLRSFNHIMNCWLMLEPCRLMISHEVFHDNYCTFTWWPPICHWFSGYRKSILQSPPYWCSLPWDWWDLSVFRPTRMGIGLRFSEHDFTSEPPKAFKGNIAPSFVLSPIDMIEYETFP